MADSIKEMTSAQATGALRNIVRSNQRFISKVLTDKPVNIYRLDDFGAIREALFNNVRNALTERFPLCNDRYTLSLDDLDYEKADHFGTGDQKKAILEGRSLTRKLRGSWVLRKADTDEEVARTGVMTIMKVPYMTERGTFIRNGHEYVFNNIMRLEPGVYVKKKDNEASAQFNIRKGSGGGFKMRLIPETGIFQIQKGTSNCPAYTVLRDMGVSDEAMQQAWGEELFKKNREVGSSNRAVAAASYLYNN